MWRNHWWFLICLFVVGIQAQESPCPGLFQYVRPENQWIGVVTVPSRYFGSTIDLKVELSLGEELFDETKFGDIEVFGDQRTVATNVANGGNVTYIVNFPSQFRVPKVTSIEINNEEYCEGEPERYSNTVRYITAITLSHRLIVESLSGINYDFPNDHIQTSKHRYPTTRPRPKVQPQVRPPNRQPNPPRPRPNPPPSSTAPPPTDPPRPVTNEPTPSSQSPNLIDDFEEPCGISPSRAKGLIRNGDDTKPGDWPWMAAIYYPIANKLDFICSGTLVSRTEVVTAAHCVYKDEKIINLVVKLGIYNMFNWTEPYTIIPKIEKISPHGEFDQINYHNDIAVIKISRVEYSEFIKPACLWGFTDIRLSSIVEDKGTVVGWGNDENNQLSPMLKSSEARIVSTDTCRNDNKDLIKYTSNKTICAGNKDGSGPCNGDSGGGLYLKINSRWHLRGIVSNSLPNPKTNQYCENKDYVVYTDAAQYTSWIENVD